MSDLPEIMFVEDVAAVLRLSRSATRSLIKRGECGPWSRVGRRLVVRRDAFLQHLEMQEASSVDARPIPAQKRFVEMLQD